MPDSVKYATCVCTDSAPAPDPVDSYAVPKSLPFCPMNACAIRDWDQVDVNLAPQDCSEVLKVASQVVASCDAKSTMLPRATELIAVTNPEVPSPYVS